MIRIVTMQWCITILLTCPMYTFRDIQFICRVNQQVKEGQQLEECKTRLYVRPVAFEMYEGIFHNDGPLDWNPGGCTQHRMYASPSDTWRLTSVGGIHWPPRWVPKCLKYATTIYPILNGFCSLCDSDFYSISVCIAMNKPCVPKLLIILFLVHVHSDCLFEQRKTGNFLFERALSWYC